MSFFDNSDGYQHWQSVADTWTNRQGDTWHFDINDRAVRESNDGVVSIYPNAAGSTAWFADVLNNDSSDHGTEHETNQS